MNELELVLDARADLGEGPVWDSRTNRLAWVDIMAARLNFFDPASGATASFETGQPIGAAVPRASGGFVLALQSGFAHLDLESGHVEPLASFDGARPEVRMNDGKCDAAGRFWAGTMAFDFRPGAGALYRLDPGLGVNTIVPGVTISNGLDWTLDGQAMYYVDTPTGRIDLFDFDPLTGAIANRRPFVEIPPSAGSPDGMTVDSAGNIWLALWGGSAVRCYSPQGLLERVVEVPASQVTSCAFGGPDLADLYITSARGGLTPEQLERQPHAGSVFRVRPGVSGRPANSFAG